MSESLTTKVAAPQASGRLAAGNAERAGKYLIFRLGREEFGAAVLKVREIIGMQDITAVPQTPEAGIWCARKCDVWWSSDA